MGQWVEALVFGLTIAAFVIGLSCIIMGFMPQQESGMKEKVEYGFFGVSSLVIGGLLSLAIAWQ
jgi:hypothetical protein